MQYRPFRAWRVTNTITQGGASLCPGLAYRGPPGLKQTDYCKYMTMPKVAFTPNLQRHVECPPQEVAGETVREVLNQIFDSNPRLQGYVLDEQGALRKHMVIFVNGKAILDRDQLSDRVPENGEVFVFQALSGG